MNDKYNYSFIKIHNGLSHSQIYRVAKMMSTHNFDHPIYSTGWTLSDWFQFSFENTVLSCRFTFVLIDVLFRISMGYLKKSEENADFTLHYEVAQILCNTIICFCRFGIFIIHLPRMFTSMHLKCKQC